MEWASEHHARMDVFKELSTPEASDFIAGNGGKLLGKIGKAAIGAAGAAGAWALNKLRGAKGDRVGEDLQKTQPETIRTTPKYGMVNRYKRYSN